MTDDPPERVDVDVTTFTPEDRDFLRALAENGGEADTTTIRNDAALKRDQVHYRYDTLAERGLITVDRVGDAHDGRTANTARLTDRGEQLVASGRLDEIEDPNTNLAAVRDRLDRIEQSLDRRVRAEREAREQLDDSLSRQIAELWDTVDLLVEELEQVQERLNTHQEGDQTSPDAQRRELE